jgi:hypothetical protein
VPARSLGIVIGAAFAAALIGCSIFSSAEPGYIISLDDPGGRLGPPPWKLAVFNPYFGPEQARAMHHAGSAAPGRPFLVATRNTVEQWRVEDLVVRDQSMVFGLVLPPLRADGYWLVQVDHEPDVFSGTGTARFCRWGQIEPDEHSEELQVTVRHRSEAPGLQLETMVRIPAQPGTNKGDRR